MKFAMFWDTAISIESHYVKEGTAYSFKTDEPYMYTHAISPQCFMAGGNYPFLYGNGDFINISEWDELPDLELEFILYRNERVGLDDENRDKYSVQRLRDKYPNATIIGWLCEVSVQEHRYDNWIKFLNDCDGILTSAAESMKTLPQFVELEKHLNKKIRFSPFPINIDYIYDNFYSEEKEESIYAYIPNPLHRRGRTYEFANYIGQKYDIPVKFKSLEPGQKFDYLSQKEFMELWTPSAFHFNLDPMDCHPGNQAVQVANVGSINFGGLNESHHLLFPETATNDEQVLEEKFVEYLNNHKKRFEVIQYAWNKLNETYGFTAVRKNIETLLKEGF